MLMNRRYFGALITAALASPVLLRGQSLHEGREVGQADLVAATNYFGSQLLREFSRTKSGENIFFSPFSLESALNMTAEGARNNTALEMGKVLGYPVGLSGVGAERPWNMKTLHEAARSLTDSLTGALSDGKNEIRIANSLWADKSLPLHAEFLKVTNDYYGSGSANQVDYKSDAEGARRKINGWISDKTNARIDELIQEGVLDSLTRLVLANAIYFQGTWLEQFNEKRTMNAAFTLASGEEKETPFMYHRITKGAYAAFSKEGELFETPQMQSGGEGSKPNYPTDGFHAVELPYTGDRLSMVVAMPLGEEKVTGLEANLSPEWIAKIQGGFKKRSVDVYLPKFKWNTSYDLKQSLIKLGMTEAFSDAADFSGLVNSSRPEDQLKITDVVHAGFVQVNEKGTEAAAATAVVMGLRSARPQGPFVPMFRANKPFLFWIQDRVTGTVLFFGKYEKPAV